MIPPHEFSGPDMLLSLLLVLCFAAGVGVSFAWQRLALALRWFDYPNARSSHTRPTPKGGGLGLALLLVAVLLLLRQQELIAPSLLWLCLPGLGLALVGLLDDLRELGIRLRLCLQFMAVLAAFWMLGGVPLLPLPGGVQLQQPWLLLLAVPAWLWLINLYNFMDGIDGLAASEGVFVALALAWFAERAGLHDAGVLLLVLAVLLGAFLCFNWSPAQLFMGDAGSNFLGYLLVAGALWLAQEAAITPWTLLILLACFVVDSTLTLVKRMCSGAVWYHGHRSHAYQVMARSHGSHARVVVAVMLLNVCWLLPLAVLSVQWPEWGAVLWLAACLPLLVLVHRCQLKHLGPRLP